MDQKLPTLQIAAIFAAIFGVGYYLVKQQDKSDKREQKLAGILAGNPKHGRKRRHSSKRKGRKSRRKARK